MKNNLLITISRQFGSSGHQIAEQLSQSLDLPLFDKDSIAQAAKDYGMYARIMTEDHPTPTNSLLYSIAANMYSLSRSGLSFEQQVSMAEEETMRNLAKEGPSIFIGRAADAVFANHPNRISFFIHAPLEWRIERITKLYHITDSKAQSMIKQMDRKRATYYAERSDTPWGHAAGYHFSIDSSMLGTAGTTEQILTFLRAYQYQE
ncbi:MAG: cytidylate kinase-like family protein [Clostridia bacterium]|nr:cytidylate kinase-like family protein [Clostridia bacterium]